ncbi:MAG: AAA family ATPase [Actinomycetota bacterium]|nr:AAA family ATPase [Actinomycetota bacterium]
MGATDLVLVSGKGGTGKSAVTAALAIERALRGQTVLAIDLGTGLGLGTHLRTSSLTYEPTQVRTGVWAMTMVRSAALDEYLKTQLHVPGGAPSRTLAGALSVLVDTAPGVREIISIGKPIFETWKEKWDAVIVDTPSLGQFQSYLRAPSTIAALVPTGRVKRQAGSLTATLSDSSITQVVLVSNPAELPVIETVEAIETITSERLCPTPIVVMNRIVAKSGITEGHVKNLVDGPLREAAVHQRSVESLQHHWMAQIDIDVSLPYLMGVSTPGEVAVQLAAAMRAG